MVGLVNDINLNGNHIPSLEGMRQKGKMSFLEQGIPSSKNENWKYTKIRELNATDFVIKTKSENKCCCEQQTLNFDTYEIRFCNGKLCHSHFHLPDEIEVMSLLDAVESKETLKYLNKTFDMDKFPFAALNTMYLEQGVFIRVCKNYKPDKPLALVYHINADNKYMCNIHNIIITESASSLDLIEYFYHTGEIKAQYFNNIVNEFFVGKNSCLKHYKVQNEAFKSTHIALNCINVKSDGRYESFCYQKGADLARNETIVHLQEENAHACVNAAYVMNGWATIDTTTNIEHLCQNTTSNQLIKGVVNGYAKGVFKGKIHIAPNAVKTQGYQLHKALILSDEAEIDVKPELEIFADDVKCSHGATCGELDKDQMFYLRSRGISEDNAKKILIAAFIEEPFSAIDSVDIKNWLQSF